MALQETWASQAEGVPLDLHLISARRSSFVAAISPHLTGAAFAHPAPRGTSRTLLCHHPGIRSGTPIHASTLQCVWQAHAAQRVSLTLVFACRLALPHPGIQSPSPGLESSRRTANATLRRA